eukprot:Em0010g932a
MCSCLHLPATKVDECVGAAKCLDVGLDKRSVLPLLSENGCLHVFDCVSRAPPGAKEQAPQPVPLLHSRWGVLEVLELNSEGALRIAVIQRSGELSAYQFDTVTLQWKLLGNERLTACTLCSAALCIKSGTFVYCEQLEDKKGYRVLVRKLEKVDDSGLSLGTPEVIVVRLSTLACTPWPPGCAWCPWVKAYVWNTAMLEPQACNCTDFKSICLHFCSLFTPKPGKPSLVAVTSNVTSNQLVTLASDGQLTCFSYDGDFAGMGMRHHVMHRLLDIPSWFESPSPFPRSGIKLTSLYTYWCVFSKGVARVYDSLSGELVWQCDSHEGIGTVPWSSQSPLQLAGLLTEQDIWVLKSKQMPTHPQSVIDGYLPVTMDTEEAANGKDLQNSYWLSSQLCRAWGLDLQASRYCLDAVYAMTKGIDEGALEDGQTLPYLPQQVVDALPTMCLQNPSLSVALLVKLKAQVNDFIEGYKSGQDWLLNTQLNADTVQMLMEFVELCDKYDTILDNCLTAPQHPTLTTRQHMINILTQAYTTVLVGDDEGPNPLELHSLAQQHPEDALAGIRAFLAVPSFKQAVEEMNAGVWRSVVNVNWKRVFANEMVRDETVQGSASKVPLYELTCRLLYQLEPLELVQFVEFAKLHRAKTEGSYMREHSMTMLCHRALEAVTPLVADCSVVTVCGPVAVKEYCQLLLMSQCPNAEMAVTNLLVGRRMWSDAILLVRELKKKIDNTRNSDIHQAVFHKVLTSLSEAGVLKEHLEEMWDLIPKHFRFVAPGVGWWSVGVAGWWEVLGGVFDFLRVLKDAVAYRHDGVFVQQGLAVQDVVSKLLQLLQSSQIDPHLLDVSTNMGRCPSMAGGPQQAFCFFVVIIVAQLGSAAQIRFAQVPSNLTVVDTAPIVLRCAVTPLKNAPLGSVRYMWEKDGTPYANTQWINLTSASSGDAGWYVCIAIHGNRAIRSEPALVEVTARAVARGVEDRNGTSDGSVVAIAVAVPLSLLGLLLATIVVSVAAVVCTRRRKRPSAGNNQMQLEEQTSEEMSLLTSSNTTSAQSVKQVPVTLGDGDGDKGAGEGGIDNGADAKQRSTDNHGDLDDLQLDVTLFEHTVHTGGGAFSADNLTVLNEAPSLQRSPRIANLSHIRLPKTGNGDVFPASNLPRSNDAMQRVFHSLISIPAAGVSEATTSDGAMLLDAPMASRNQRRVSVPASIPNSPFTDVQTTQCENSTLLNIDQKIEPHEASAGPQASDVGPCVPNVASQVALAGGGTPAIADPCANVMKPLTESNAAVESLAGYREPHTAVAECADEIKSDATVAVVTPTTVSSVEENKTGHHEQPFDTSPLNVQSKEQQLQSKVSDLRQRFLPGPVETPPIFTTATSQRLLRSKLITQKTQQLFSQQSSLDGAQATTGCQEGIATVPESTAGEAAGLGGREQVAPNRDAHVQLAPGEIDLASSNVTNRRVSMEEERQSVMSPVAGVATDDDGCLSNRDRAYHSVGARPEPYTGGLVELPSGSHTKPFDGGQIESGGSQIESGGSQIECSSGRDVEPQREHAGPHQGGHEEPPRGGLTESSRELSSAPTRPRPVSPVFARHASKLTSPQHYRPTSNLLVSMSAGSPASTGKTPPPVRRVSSPNSPKSCVSSRHGDTGGNLSLDEISCRTASVVASSNPVIPYRTSQGSDDVHLQMDRGGGVSSSSGDEDTWSINSDEELIAPLVMAPPPAKRVDSTEDSFPHHHPHHDSSALSPKVKDCISEMTKIVHTQPLFSEPKKMHSRRQRNKLSIIPEDSPTVSS